MSKKCKWCNTDEILQYELKSEEIPNVEVAMAHGKIGILFITKDDEHQTICFDVNYCPICGKPTTFKAKLKDTIKLKCEWEKVTLHFDTSALNNTNPLNYVDVTMYHHDEYLYVSAKTKNDNIIDFAIPINFCPDCGLEHRTEKQKIFENAIKKLKESEENHD